LYTNVAGYKTFQYAWYHVNNNTLQEVLAAQLVKEGQMIRRERTYEGIDVNYLVLDKLAVEHGKIADAITDIIRDLIGFQATYVDGMVEEFDKIAVAENKEVELTK